MSDIKSSYTYTYEELLERLHDNSEYIEDNVLCSFIFNNENNMIPLSEAMKYHNLWNMILINNICIKSNIIFFKFMFYNDDEFIDKFNILFLFQCIKNNNREAVDMLLDRYPEIIYNNVSDSWGCLKNILHYISKSNWLDLFKIIAARYPQALIQKGRKYPLCNLIENVYEKHSIDDTIKICLDCLEYCDNDPEYINMIYNIADKCHDLNTRIFIFEKLKNHQDLIDKLLINFIEYFQNIKLIPGSGFKYRSDSQLEYLYESIEILLRDYNANPNKIYDEYHVQFLDHEYYNVSAVGNACYYEAFEILMLLERYNGNLNNQELASKCTYHNNRKIIEYLKNNYNLNFNVMDDNNEYTIAINLFTNHTENYDACEYIIECDIDLTALGHNGQSFIHLWIMKIINNNNKRENMHEKMNMIFKLIDRGVDPYHKDNNGDYFFSMKARRFDDMHFLFTHDEYIMLHQHGIDLTLPNGNGCNLLDILHERGIDLMGETKFYGNDLSIQRYDKLYNLFANEFKMTLSK